MEAVSNTIVILSPSPSAFDLASRIRTILKEAGKTVELHGKGDQTGTDRSYEDTMAHMRELFSAGSNIVALYASGIVIRALGPILTNKFDEPAVLSVARDGSSVVPLLGGHHGANDLSKLIAQSMTAHAAITTAGDCTHKLALDLPPDGWRLQNAKGAAPKMARIASGESIDLDPALSWANRGKLSVSKGAKLKLRADYEAIDDSADNMVYAPKRLVIGLGCERGCSSEHLISHVENVLASHKLAPEAIGLFASIDLKMDEAALHATAAHFQSPIRFFPAGTLEQEKDRLQNPSDVVFAEVGCHGVAEGAALVGAGPEGSLLVPKVKSDKATCAIGLSKELLVGDLHGKKRGRLAVIGIGPGQSEWRTPEATSLIAQADELVGYGLYIDLLGDLANGKKRSDFPLGGEEDRCRYALEEAGKGANVALICSGDAGIYAMGALVMELLDRPSDGGGVSDDAKCAELIHAPGISALQAASARFGALLGHDFCTISLSDLLTPWETIEQRLEAASKGDFVVAFYNPVSMKRRTQLATAKEILLKHRAPETPVLLASNLGREQEQLRIRQLGALEVDEVDMLTVVLVGSSQSRALLRGDRSVGDAGWQAYTPRGYAKRIDAK